MGDSTVVAPLTQVLNKKISPLFREIEKLQLLKITKISLPTPTIVFCGENSAGKSSLINSLSGISLPVGDDGYVSTHPLILNITGKPNNTNAETELFIEDERGVKVSVKEDGLRDAFKKNTCWPLKLHVKKVDRPNVTLIDLPGTSRVHKDVIQDYISPEDRVVVNVVSAENCFAPRLISSNQEIAKRSLVVFTKVDKLIGKSAENLLLKLNLDKNAGLTTLAQRGVEREKKKDEGGFVDVYISTISNTLGRILQDIDDDISTCIQDVAKLEKPSVSRILKLTENNLRVSFLSREFVDIEEPAKFASNHLYRILENFFNGLTKTAREHIAKKDPEEADYYPELFVLLSAAGNKLTKKLREEFKSNMIQLFESEKDAHLNWNPDFDVTKQAKIQNDCNEVIQFVNDRKESAVFAMESYTIYELGSSTGVDTKLEHLWSYPQELLYEALNLRFKTNSYRYKMFKRFCEMVGIHLHHLIKKFIDETFYLEMTMELEDGLIKHIEGRRSLFHFFTNTGGEKIEKKKRMGPIGQGDNSKQ
ncbi:dynamin-related protein 4C-like protein [Tanacetum coccineum]